MDTIDITICIFAYNNEKYILESIESVRKQHTKYQMELIVFDDCSTDRTVDTIRKEYGDSVCVVVNESNLGYCRTLYNALTRVRGRYLCSLAGDDYLCSDNIIERMVSFLDNNNQYGSVSGWNYVINEKKEIIGEHKNTDKVYSILDYLLGKRPNCYEGVVRNFWKDTNIDYTFLTKGARNNEELLFWMMTLNYAPKAIIQDYYFTYRYINNNSGDNYNSSLGKCGLFKDNYANLKVVKKVWNYYCFDGLTIKLFVRELIDALYKKEYLLFLQLLFILNFRDRLVCICNAFYYHNHNGQLRPSLVKKIERCTIINADKNV